MIKKLFIFSVKACIVLAIMAAIGNAISHK